MAADSLEKAAKELGVEIKIETQGADGIQNELTRKDIEESFDKYFSVKKIKKCYNTNTNINKGGLF